MQEMITLNFLFHNREVFTNTLGAGGLDGINLHLAVSRDLKTPGVWAGILNLCARLCFETISFDTPLIIPKDQVSTKGPWLMVDLHREDDGPPGVISIIKKDLHQVCIQSASAQAMAMVLNGLAMGSLGRSTLSDPGSGISKLKTLAPGDELTGYFDPRGKLTDCRINGKRLGNLCLKPREAKGRAAEKKPHSLFHPLDFRGLYKNETSMPTRQTLDAVWVIQGTGLSFNAGVALFDAISAMVMEATAICLPLVVCNQNSANLIKSGSPQSGPCHFVVHETNPAKKDLHNLTVQFPDPSGPVYISGTAQGISEHLAPWIHVALNPGVPGFSRSQTLRNQAAFFVANPHGRNETKSTRKSFLPLVYQFRLGSETDEILGTLYSARMRL